MHNSSCQSREAMTNRNRLGFGFPGEQSPIAGRRGAENLSGFLLSTAQSCRTASAWNRSTGKMFRGLTGHCKTARKAAVAVLRGNGGTFPSQAHMSDPSGVQERAEGAINSRVILQVMPLLRAWPDSVPFDNRTVIVLTNLVHSGLGEYLPMRTLLLPSCIKG